MQTLYTCNFPPDETVNFRKGAGRKFSIVARIAYGEMVEGEVFNEAWHFVHYKGQTGYIMSRYLSERSPHSDGDFVPVLVDTASNGNGGRLNIRKSPDKGAKLLGRIKNGAALWAQKEGKLWRKVKFGDKHGYVMTKFLKLDEKEKKENDNPPENILPEISYPFSHERAVLYALNHSDNSSSPLPCQNRNRSFLTINGKNDCADFAHQCLVAGGAPMFDGWYYRLKGIPARWQNSGWPWTNRGRKALLEKGWIERIAHHQVGPGDIIYTYNQNATPTPYSHVTIAVSPAEKIGEKIFCTVCGNTTNQHRAKKRLNEKNCRCYRIKDTLIGDGSEKLVRLPLIGSGAEVLNEQSKLR